MSTVGFISTSDYNQGYAAGWNANIAIYHSDRAEVLQAKADNVALHKGIRRLNNKIERLQGQLRMACEDIAHLQYQSDVEQGIEPPAFGVPQRFIDDVLKEYNLLLKEESLRDQS